MSKVPALLELPPELILHILSFLPVRSLLNFSLASKTSHTLSTSSLHTLSLGVFLRPLSSVVSRLAAIPTPVPTNTHSAFNDLSTSLSYSDSTSSLEESPSKAFDGPNTVNVMVPDAAKSLDFETLYTFQSALRNSVLQRYQNSLRSLDLSLWSLDSHTTSALASLKNLRALSLRIEDPTHISQGRRRRASVQRAEERASWSHLAGAWQRLEALRIEGAAVTITQVFGIVEGNKNLRELWLLKCSRLTGSFWRMLSGNAHLQRNLEILNVSGCGGDLDESVLEHIDKFTALKFLALIQCREVVPGSVEKANSKRWKIPELIIPKSMPSTAIPEVIEVDPAYMDLPDDEQTYNRDLDFARTAIEAGA